MTRRPERSSRRPASSGSRPATRAVLLTLEVGKLVPGGLGLARDADGVVLVEGALPGETVIAEVRASRGVRRGVTKHVEVPSPDRVEAPGLPTTDLGHARYEAQLRYKRDFVLDALTRIAKLDVPVAPTVPSPREWAYRSTVQYLRQDDTLAYRERRGHTPVRVDHDPLALDAITAFLGRLDVWALDPATELVLRASTLTGEVLAALVGEGGARMYRRAIDALQDAGAVGVSLAPPAERRFGQGERLLAGEPTVLERYGRLDLSVSATGFAQVNPVAAGPLYVAAAELCGTGTHLLDLYGGAGGFGLHAAGGFRQVTVVDVAAEALARGERDARRLGLGHVRFTEGDARRVPDADVVLADPPRAGLSTETLHEVVDSRASRLVYVSCDPATWARDVGVLQRHGWTLESVTPYDFYPQTHHVEVLSLLTR